MIFVTAEHIYKWADCQKVLIKEFVMNFEQEKERWNEISHQLIIKI